MPARLPPPQDELFGDDDEDDDDDDDGLLDELEADLQHGSAVQTDLAKQRRLQLREVLKAVTDLSTSSEERLRFLQASTAMIYSSTDGLFAARRCAGDTAPPAVLLEDVRSVEQCRITDKIRQAAQIESWKAGL